MHAYEDRKKKVGDLIIPNDNKPTLEVIGEGQTRLYPDSRYNASLYAKGGMTDAERQEWERLH